MQNPLSENFIIASEQSRRRNVLMNILAELKYSSIEDFQKQNDLRPDGKFGMTSYNRLYDIWLQPRPPQKPFEDYDPKTFPKTQIFLHHSASSNNADLMFQLWDSDKRGNVATPIGINDDGTVVKGFDEACRSGHVGNGRNTNSIGVEIMAYGWVQERNGKYFTAYKNEISKDKLAFLDKPYNGYKIFEAYTTAQIEKTCRWVLLNSLRFDIALNYTESMQVFDPKIRTEILRGRIGVYAHGAIEPTKSDAFPQKELLSELNNILLFEKI